MKHVAEINPCASINAMMPRKGRFARHIAALVAKVSIENRK
jgi:hypothetical protein